MKILLIYLGRLGSGPVFTFKLAENLNKKTEVSVLLSEKVENRQLWESSGLAVSFIPTFSSKTSALISFFRPKTFRKIRFLIEKINPDIIHIPMIHLWTAYLQKKVFNKIPNVITVHDPVQHSGEWNPFLFHLKKLSIKRASRIVILSDKFRKIIMKYGIEKEKIDYIPHGEYSYYKKVSNRSANFIDETNKSRTILFFGRIIKYKGLEVLLKAFGIVLGTVPDARLIIAGRGDMSRYRSLLTNNENIEIINRWIDEGEVANIFNRAGIVVTPYTNASQSGIIPLAYSMGVPVIASDVGGINEQVEDGISGLLVTPNNPILLAEKCVEVINNAVLAEALVAGGKRLIETSLDWRLIADLHIQTYENAMKDSFN